MPDRATQTLLEMQALNQVWRYLNRPESAAGLMRRLGRERLPRIKAHIKQRLDECAAHLIVLFPDPTAESLDPDAAAANAVDEGPSGELRFDTASERRPTPDRPLRVVPSTQPRGAVQSNDGFGEDQ